MARTGRGYEPLGPLGVNDPGALVFLLGPQVHIDLIDGDVRAGGLADLRSLQKLRIRRAGAVEIVIYAVADVDLIDAVTWVMLGTPIDSRIAQIATDRPGTDQPVVAAVC